MPHCTRDKAVAKSPPELRWTGGDRTRDSSDLQPQAIKVIDAWRHLGTSVAIPSQSLDSLCRLALSLHCVPGACS